MLKQLSSLYKLHNKVNPESLSKHMIHGDNEGVFHLDEDQLFNFQTLQRVVVDHHVFSDALHCVDLHIFLVLDEVDLAEGASANELQDLEVIEDIL